MTLTELDQRVELRSRRLDLASEMLDAALADDDAWLARIDAELAEIEAELKTNDTAVASLDTEAPTVEIPVFTINIDNVPEEVAEIQDKLRELSPIYCPACGTELRPAIHRQREKPYVSHISFYCNGRCYTEKCASEGLAPETFSVGVPKLHLPLGTNTDLDGVITTEVEAMKFVRIFGKQTYGFAPDDLLLRVYDRVMGSYRSRRMAIAAAFTVGWAYGIRNERRRRKERALATPVLLLKNE
ncbi:MAG: hypothetical protein ACM3UZ_03860 [Acidobacteriota bacterium]